MRAIDNRLNLARINAMGKSLSTLRTRIWNDSSVRDSTAMRNAFEKSENLTELKIDLRADDGRLCDYWIPDLFANTLPKL